MVRKYTDFDPQMIILGRIFISIFDVFLQLTQKYFKSKLYCSKSNIIQ